DLGALVARMGRRNVRAIVVTDPDGRLMGVLRFDDANAPLQTPTSNTPNGAPWFGLLATDGLHDSEPGRVGIAFEWKEHEVGGGVNGDRVGFVGEVGLAELLKPISGW